MSLLLMTVSETIDLIQVYILTCCRQYFINEVVMVDKNVMSPVECWL